ncbi:unnamed protein product [Dicrocoelium dendriticum]|nr:unnamed protein product [Dicrocoelium dendriticum]
MNELKNEPVPNAPDGQAFKDKYPFAKNRASALLQRRLSKNVKFFDSGDYNMAKNVLPCGREAAVGQTIPTPENVPTLRNKICPSRVSTVTQNAQPIMCQCNNNDY